MRLGALLEFVCTSASSCAGTTLSDTMRHCAGLPPSVPRDLDYPNLTLSASSRLLSFRTRNGRLHAVPGPAGELAVEVRRELGTRVRQPGGGGHGRKVRQDLHRDERH